MSKIECKTYNYSAFNKYASTGIMQSLKEINEKNNDCTFICIGSDLVLGDCLGPLVGTFLRSRGLSSYVYGTLNAPITAKEIEYARLYLSQMHPNTISVSIDAAVGKEEDVGTIRVQNRGLRPGLGVNKNFAEIGDISIIGIVAEKTLQNYNLFNLTRLNLVYKMATVIADGIEEYINLQSSKRVI